MALFGFGKKKEVKPVTQSVKREASEKETSRSTLRDVRSTKDVLLRPRVTEKAASMTSSNVYAFDVTMDATKKDVAAAVHALYKVIPFKVNVVNVRAKRVRMRRKRGYGATRSSRKAYVFLKKGDSISLS
jgi:large subunit ribosomal protein L23